MAACAVIANGAITLTADPVGSCPGYVLQDAAEYMLNSTLAGLVARPDVAEFAAVWAAGFILPISLALVGWACGAVMSPLRRGG